jgi:hypothetical protein
MSSPTGTATTNKRIPLITKVRSLFATNKLWSLFASSRIRGLLAINKLRSLLAINRIRRLTADCDDGAPGIVKA